MICTTEKETELFQAISQFTFFCVENILFSFATTYHYLLPLTPTIQWFSTFDTKCNKSELCMHKYVYSVICLQSLISKIITHFTLFLSSKQNMQLFIENFIMHNFLLHSILAFEWFLNLYCNYPIQHKVFLCTRHAIFVIY